MTEILFEGKLPNGLRVTMRPLGVANLPEILYLQEEVIDALEDPARLQPLSEEEFLFILEGNGDMIGVFDGEEMIAWRAMLIPDNDHEGLGRDVGVPEEDIPKVIYQEISAVSPRFRGNGLQKMMAGVLMDRVDRNRFRYVCATVMPGNIPSLKDKFSQGLEVAALKDKYGGKLRYVFVKDLAAPEQLRTRSQLIPMADIAGQQALLADGWRGTELIRTDEDWQVQYER